MNESQKKLLIYLPDQFADWEGAHLMAELTQNKVLFTVVSESRDTITSIGNLKVLPEAAITDFTADQISGLILIGGENWTDTTKNKYVRGLAAQVLQKNSVLAAICGATVALAQEGVLQGRKHTSNDLTMLKAIVPTYSDDANYVNKLAVTDGNFVTASGAGAVDFTLELLRLLGIYDEEKRQHWYKLFKHGTLPPQEFWA
ncbi:DJ-1/PfpI family protein [Bdellovibrio bacteriovorus]|uniref:DJ-1/PfpI family protein n=1 Tax=Bdellovibrio bacteriovorus TaxID=959 RepID=UPI0021CF5AD6|nr:DJ-1/PfpI family protein [Bdellovibrio bacteriovorus]UXR65937.1 DJ-1/PfpI family protein [Bdellovibrio bacteriovorus]